MKMLIPANSRNAFERIVFYAILALYAEYCILFILNTSFVANGVRYFTLHDDAMISMRYARNLVRGDGLVWNAGGGRVEGYSNFLWVLVMAVVHLFPLAPEKISCVIEILGMLILCLNLFVVRRIALFLSESHPVAIGSVILTALYYPINDWTLRGFEVGALLLAINLVLSEILSTEKDHRLSPSALLVIGLGVLIRADAAVLFTSLLVASAVFKERSPARLQWRALMVLGGVLAAHTTFRMLYYGDWLPNTYYLKMTGTPVMLRLHEGAIRLWEFIGDASAIFFLLPLLLFLMYPSKRWQVRILFATFAVQCAYSVFAGGDIYDAYHIANRYLSVVMPVLFILLSWSFWGLLENLRFKLAVRLSGREWNLKGLLYSAMVALAWYSFNQGQIYSAAVLAPALEASKDMQRVLIARAVRRLTTADAEIAVTAAGAVPYFADRRSIDILGKNDRHIARMDSRVKGEFLPGHDKWDYDYSIRGRFPDIIVELWGNPHEIQSFIDQYYIAVALNDHTRIYCRNFSPHIRSDSMAAVMHSLPE